MSQLIGHPEVVTVLIGDMDTIALSAEIKYAALESLSLGTPGTPGPGAAPRISGRGPVGSYGREYLEKLIQIQLRLPPPLPRDLRKMLVPIVGERPAFPQNVDLAELGFPSMAAKATVAKATVRRTRLRTAAGAVILGVVSALAAVSAIIVLHPYYYFYSFPSFFYFYIFFSFFILFFPFIILYYYFLFSYSLFPSFIFLAACV